MTDQEPQGEDSSKDAPTPPADQPSLWERQRALYEDNAAFEARRDSEELPFTFGAAAVQFAVLLSLVATADRRWQVVAAATIIAIGLPAALSVGLAKRYVYRAATDRAFLRRLHITATPEERALVVWIPPSDHRGMRFLEFTVMATVVALLALAFWLISWLPAAVFGGVLIVNSFVYGNYIGDIRDLGGWGDRTLDIMNG